MIDSDTEICVDAKDLNNRDFPSLLPFPHKLLTSSHMSVRHASLLEVFLTFYLVKESEAWRWRAEGFEIETVNLLIICIIFLFGCNRDSEMK